MHTRLSTTFMRLLWAVLSGVSFAAAGETVVLDFLPRASISDTAVVLGDVARISGGSDAVCGALSSTWLGRAAPPGFSRYLNAEQAVRYSVRAAHPGIEFRITGAGRVCVETLSQTMQVDDYNKDIQKYVRDKVKWPDDSYSLEVLDSTLTWRSYPGEAKVRVMGLESAYPKGSIRLSLVTEHRYATVTVPVNCRIHVQTPVLVAARRIERGEDMTKSCVDIVRKDITIYRYEPLTSAGQIDDHVAGRALTPGTIIHAGLLTAKPAVYKGDLLYITLSKGPVRVEVPARARETGAVGERIWVENTMTHKIIRVEITAAGKAAVPSKEAI